MGPYPQNGLIEYVLTVNGYPPFFIESQHILVSKVIALPGYQAPLTSYTKWWNNTCVDQNYFAGKVPFIM